MMRRTCLLPLVLSLAVFAPASAQNIRSLPRADATTGVNDSALVLVSDSASRTRAVSTHQLFLRPIGSAAKPAFSFRLDSTTGFYRFGKDTIGIAAAGGAAMFISRVGTVSQLRSTAGVLQVKASGTSSVNIGNVTNGDAVSINAGNVLPATSNVNDLGSTISVWRRLYTDSLRGVGNTSIIGGAGSMTIRAGTGASRTLTAQTTNSGSVTQNTLVLGPDTSALLGVFSVSSGTAVANGTAAAPTYAFTNSAGTGAYRFGADTLGLAAAGTAVGYLHKAGGLAGLNFLNATNDTTARLRFSLGGRRFGLSINATTVWESDVSGSTAYLRTAAGTATTPGLNVGLSLGSGFSQGGTSDTLYVITGSTKRFMMTGQTFMGGAGDMIVRAGTGNSRTLTLQTTTSTSVAKDVLVLGADSSATFLGKVIPGDTLRSAKPVRFTALTAAAGSPNTVCMNTATKELQENAASTCVVSSARYKTNIVALSDSLARHIVFGLAPATFAYRDGGALGINFIAEQADSVDARLASHDGQGRPNSINQDAVIAALVRVVQQQQAQIDSLRARTTRPRGRWGRRERQ